MSRTHHGEGGAPGPGPLASQTADAGAAFSALRDSAESAAQGIDHAFTKAGESLAATLTKAAATGKLSFADLAKSALQVVEGLLRAGSGGAASSAGAGASGLAGLATSVLGDLFGGASFGGARAEGGPAFPGAAYLVGEQGPELFRPDAAGQVQPLGAGPLTVNVQVQGQGGAPDLARSDTQIAQALARAVRLGIR